MIKRLTLENFRSHKKSIIEFSKGVNILLGRGQAGKTNIKRAIEWLCTNRPRGDKMHSFWCEKGDVTSVTLETTEGYTIKISKVVGDSVEYSLLDLRGEGATWAKVGGSVPDKVIEVLNLCELNVQNQLDQPYLITSGTGEVSRAINQAIDLDSADQWITEFNKRKKANASEVKLLTSQLGDALAKSECYAKVPEAKDSLDTAEEDVLSLEAAIDRNAGIARAITDIDHAEFALSNLCGLLELDETIARADVLGEKLDKTMSDSVALDRLMRAVNDADNELSRLGSCDAVDRVIGRAGRLTARYDGICKKQKLCADVIATNNVLCEKKEEYSGVIDDYVELLDRLGTCPTCYTPVDDETLDYVIGGLEGRNQ